MAFVLVVGAYKEIMSNGFDSEALAVWTGGCFGTANTEEVLV
jgi:hypothetical protein